MSTLLITGCGGNHFLETIPCYKPHKIIGVASDLDSSLFSLLDEYEFVCKCDSPYYMESILEKCEKHSVDILIPTLDTEMKMICDNLEMFENIGVKVSISNPDTIDIVTDKIKFNDFLKKNGFNYADYRTINSSDMLNYCLDELGHPHKPVCMKLPNKGGSRGFRVIHDEHDFFFDYVNKKPSGRFITSDTAHRILEGKNIDILLQEYLGGGEYSVDMVCENGEVLAIAGRENIIVDNSIPLESVVKKDKIAYEISKDIADKLRLYGNIGVDFVRDKNGVPVPIEINARITATIGLFARAGINLPMIQVNRLLGYKYGIPDVIHGVKMKKEYKAVYEGGI